jgi:hypothetical protein
MTRFLSISLGMAMAAGLAAACNQYDSATATPGETAHCAENQCGQRPEIQQTKCSDGSMGGLIGCMRQMNGTCGWETRSCPEEAWDYSPREGQAWGELGPGGSYSD